MNTFLDYLTVLTVLTLLSAPALHGLLRERRTDRQLRGAAAGRSGADTVRARTQKSSSRSTVPSTATW
ncbi:hypothetical protein ACIQUQ_00510 [Streptomyces sp. NPDC101118]|uniref:hypothetical protein n=1 Tax=Streptomyces sp. NPDC101118 TaxID=3366109 RepID=UPI003826F1F7